jgi:hypothetical protein
VSGKVAQGTLYDWETWENAKENTSNYDPEKTAREMSRFLGDMVAGANLTHEEVIGNKTDVPHPMLFTENLYKQHSKGAENGLIKKTETVTNKVAQTERQESEIYIIGEGYEVEAVDYDFSQGMPQPL